jgi:uncharacterized protein YdhG (YjbR/CyaY superfamily)
MSEAKKTSAGGFTEAERAAMKERAEELKAEKGGKKKAQQAQACLDKIAELPEPDRALAERIHAIVMDVAPLLQPKTWYGMPAYANADGKNVVFFQPASKFDVRYATLGFEEAAAIDEGTMWPTAWAITDLTEDDVEFVRALVKRAVG